MNVNVEVKCGREFVKRAMLATMGITKLATPEEYRKRMKTELSNKTFTDLLKGLHSPIEEYEIWVDAIVPERVHTHVVRHKELGKYVATSRPDLKHVTELLDGQRILSLRFNAKRLIEVCQRRLCKASWHETTELFSIIRKNIPDDTLWSFLAPTCTWQGFCSERTECGWNKSGAYISSREFLTGESNGRLNK